MGDLTFGFGRFCTTALLAALLSSCGVDDLSCSSNSAQALVVQIAKEEAANSRSLYSQIIRENKVRVANIRTTQQSANKAICAADLAAGSADDVTMPIEYTLQMTSEKKVYATVYGLQ